MAQPSWAPAKRKGESESDYKKRYYHAQRLDAEKNKGGSTYKALQRKGYEPTSKESSSGRSGKDPNMASSPGKSRSMDWANKFAPKPVKKAAAKPKAAAAPPKKDPPARRAVAASPAPAPKPAAKAAPAPAKKAVPPKKAAAKPAPKAAPKKAAAPKDLGIDLTGAPKFGKMMPRIGIPDWLTGRSATQAAQKAEQKRWKDVK